jgi:hypothetical protein
MSHLKSRTAGIAIGLSVSFSFWLGACAQDAARNQVEQVGTVSATLVTTGSDGSLYRFPAGSLLVITNNTFNDQFALDGDGTVLNLTLPVGSYRVAVDFPGQLERTPPGSDTAAVFATWVDPQPVDITIVQDTTLSLVLHFQAQGLGDVTFDQGGLAVALAVERLAKQTPAQYLESGTYTNQSQEFGPSASAALQAALGMAPNESHTYALSYNVLGPWVQRNTTQVCAPVVLDAEVFDTDSGFSRAVFQFRGAPAIFCIEDDGLNDGIIIGVDRQGAAPFGQQSFLPGTNYSFVFSMTGFVGDVYDGRTLAQSKLETFTALTSGVIQHVIFDQDIGEQLVFSLGTLVTNVKLVP